MEGPSLVIATEDLAPFVGKRVRAVGSDGRVDLASLQGKTLTGVRSWGKHLLLEFGARVVRIHFLMFGSYRVDEQRDRPARLSLSFGNGEVFFYSCAVRELEPGALETYDWTIDVMSPAWDRAEVLRRVNARKDQRIDDVLLDQDVFAGVGNIIKNEVLFNLRLPPDLLVGALTPAQRGALVDEAHAYSHRFYAWKKANVLKRNWHIFRKRACPECGGPVTRAKTGALQRWSHFCESCQRVQKAPPRAARARRRPARTQRRSGTGE